MDANSLIDAVKTGDLKKVESLLESGASVDDPDQQGWSALNHAAGKGEVDLIKLLLYRGADVFNTGRDNRTPYLIALAAGRVEAARVLREAEHATDPVRARSSRPPRQYCKAYHLSDLQQFPGWQQTKAGWQAAKAHKSNAPSNAGVLESDGPESDGNDEVVFIHQDFTVTESMWHNESVIFDQISPEWLEFCDRTLGFKVPDDLDLIANVQQVA
jgi:ankyrin repeat protein